MGVKYSPNKSLHPTKNTGGLGPVFKPVMGVGFFRLLAAVFLAGEFRRYAHKLTIKLTKAKCGNYV